MVNWPKRPRCSSYRTGCMSDRGREAGFLLPSPFQKKVERRQADADADARVGDVEGRPVMLSDEKVDEIHDVSETQAIDEIPERASKDEGEARLGRRVGN